MSLQQHDATEAPIGDGGSHERRRSSAQSLSVPFVSPSRLAQYESAASEGFFDAIITLGAGDVTEQIAPVRQALLDRLAHVRDQVARQLTV